MKYLKLLLFYLLLAFMTETCCKDTPPLNTEVKETGLALASEEELATTGDVPQLLMGTLPQSFALKMPEAGDQGTQGSCTSWAVGYAVGSRFMNINDPDPYQDNAELASPKYIYNQLSKGKCGGTSFPANLNILQNKGICSLKIMPYTDSECEIQPSNDQDISAQTNKILRWEKVDKTDLINVKSLIYAGYPILIAVNIDEEFDNLAYPYIWNHSRGSVRGAHALTVTGWDDKKNALKILNSWGKTWADSGFLWIDYSFFPNAVIGKECYVAYPIEKRTNDDLGKGLVLYFPFKGNADDASGNNNNGIISGATIVSDRKGIAKSACQFGGFNNPGVIRVPNSATLQFSNSFTFAAWVRINNKDGMDGYGSYSITASQHCLFAKDWDRGLAHALVNYSNIYGYSGFYTGLYANTGSVATNISYNEGQWMHLVYSYTGNELKLYKDGALVISTSGGLDFSQSNSKDLYLGRFSSFWYPLDGLLDEVRIYNRALSASEIQKLYQL